MDAAIDWLDGEPAPEVWNLYQRDLARRICLARAVEHWKAADATFGAVGFSDIGVLRAPTEGFRRYLLELIPLKQQFGIA